MNTFAIVCASVVAALFLTLNAGCAAHVAEPAKIAEPIAYDKADYTPPSDFDMAIDTNVSTFDAPKVKAPPTTAFAPRLVSMERTTSLSAGQ